MEEMFAERPTDSALLDRMRQELKYRKTPRAVALLRKVEAATLQAEPASALSMHPSGQATTSKSGITRVPSVDAGAESLPLLLRAQEAPRKPSQAPTGGKTSASTECAQAYALLKISPGSPWESVELARRKLVQQSSPASTLSMSAGDRVRMKEHAELVNAAYAFLAKQR